ncbi:hypothetical protein [Larkinella soli]|uniref:hypothetical protein n=1 Tax=Larkinella soli TaxID=1770527 RepID=UPI000FFC0CE0|nr:hypothetical protein [Larkinella soli]
MKRFTKWYGFALAGLLAVGCENRDKAIQPQLEQNPVAIRIDQSARISQNVNVTVEKIEDSRCPANAVCVWMGFAKVTFTLKSGTASQTSDLCLGMCGQQQKTSDVAVIRLDDRSYEVTLSEIRPYPGTKPDGTPQEAVLSVTEKK